MLSPFLDSLTEREAIKDALYRAVIGFDSYDVGMFESAWDGEEVYFDLNGEVTHGMKDIKSKILDFVGPLDTSHTISNIRVDFKEGSTTANLEAYALAQHCPPGKGMDPNGPKFLANSTYNISLNKDVKNGLWRIKSFSMKIIWTQGDPSVMERKT